jgi:hypothetical protein
VPTSGMVWVNEGYVLPGVVFRSAIKAGVHVRPSALLYQENTATAHEPATRFVALHPKASCISEEGMPFPTMLYSESSKDA